MVFDGAHVSMKQVFNTVKTDAEQWRRGRLLRGDLLNSRTRVPTECVVDHSRFYVFSVVSRSDCICESARLTFWLVVLFGCTLNRPSDHSSMEK